MVDDPPSLPKNYTPLPVTKSTHGENKVLTFLVLNLVAFLSAASLIGIVGIQRQIALKQNVTSTKASEIKRSCPSNSIQNPTSVSAYVKVNEVEKEIKNESTIAQDSVIFKWEPIQSIKSYFLLLSPNKSNVDPVQEGIEVKTTTYEATGLKPGETYYLYIRSKDQLNKFSNVFPTPGNCFFVIPANIIFTFTMKK